MAHLAQKEAARVIHASARSSKALELARVFRVILEKAAKKPGEYVRLWNIPGGAE